MNFCRFVAGCALSSICTLCSAGGVLPPTITKAFGLANISLNASTSLSFGVGNNDPLGALTAITFTDVLPPGLVVSTPNGLTGTCGGGTIVAIAGTSTIKLTGAQLLADQSCNFRVNVTGVALGLQNNVTGVVSALESGPGGTAKASVVVDPLAPPQVSTAKNFSPSTINAGQSTSLTIALSNNDVVNPANQVGFSDSFPAGMTLASGAQDNTCGGTLVAAGGKITLSNGTLGADGGSCAVSVRVTAIGNGTLTNVTSAITCINPQGSACSGNAASADLNVIGTAPPNVAPVITSAPPPPGTLGIFYSYPITATGSPTPTIGASGLPPGLSYSQPGNLIFGTPTLEGSFATTIVASNGVQPNAVGNYTIAIINPLAISIPDGGNTLPGGTTGKPYGPVPFTVSGGTPPYTWSACGRPLPPGLNLSAGGIVAGTPTQAGSFDFDVCVMDSQGTPKAQPFTVVVGTVTTTMTMTVTPNPAASGIPVVVAVQVTGASVAATGLVQFWVAGAGTKCPSPFVAGAPNDPNAAVRTAPLDANGRAQLPYANLRIDDYFVCAKYAGDGLYSASSAGPIGLAVIKGFLLPPPAVTLAVPASVVPAATLSVRVMVAGSDGSPVPEGIVRVRIAENEIATASLVNGGAVITVRMPEAGAVTFTADYAGDGNYPPASSSDATVQIANGAATVTGIEIIPTLSEWAVGLLALMLGMFGLRRLRRI